MASLAACVGFYARRFLARHHLDAAGLRVEAAFTMSPDRPARVDTITLRLLLPGRWRKPPPGAAGGRRPLHRPQLPPHPTRGAGHAGRARRPSPAPLATVGR